MKGYYEVDAAELLTDSSCLLKIRGLHPERVSDPAFYLEEVLIDLSEKFHDVELQGVRRHEG